MHEGGADDRYQPSRADAQVQPSAAPIIRDRERPAAARHLGTTRLERELDELEREMDRRGSGLVAAVRVGARRAGPDRPRRRLVVDAVGRPTAPDLPRVRPAAVARSRRRAVRRARPTPRSLRWRAASPTSTAAPSRRHRRCCRARSCDVGSRGSRRCAQRPRARWNAQHKLPPDPGAAGRIRRGGLVVVHGATTRRHPRRGPHRRRLRAQHAPADGPAASDRRRRRRCPRPDARPVRASDVARPRGDPRLGGGATASTTDRDAARGAA